MKSLISLLFLFTFQIANANANSTIVCSADYSIVDLGQIEIKVEKDNEGLKGYINNNLRNQNVAVYTFDIREGMQYPIDTYDASANYNFGELSLSIIYDQDNIDLEGEELPKEFRSNIEFNLTDVATVVVYDLTPNNSSLTDKFGGEVLIEAFDAVGNLLGRVARSSLSKVCK